MKTTLNLIKNQYAQEQGYEDWDNFVVTHISMSSHSKNTALTVLESHMNEICLRAQKAALEKAAENAKVEHYNTRTGVKESASGMGSHGQVYTIDRASITHEQNLVI